jgi:hypothetical protein
MAKLTAKEKQLLDQLSAKAEAPDSPSTARSLNVSIDLGDEKQVARAQKLGLLDPFDDDDDDGGDDADDTPKRRSYFDN